MFDKAFTQIATEKQLLGEEPYNCNHTVLSSVVVSTQYTDGNLSVIAIVSCKSCSATWTAQDNNAIRTY